MRMWKWLEARVQAPKPLCKCSVHESKALKKARVHKRSQVQRAVPGAER